MSGLTDKDRAMLKEAGSHLLTQADAARELGITPQRFDQLVGAGTIVATLEVVADNGRSVRLYDKGYIKSLRSQREKYPTNGRGPYPCWTDE